MIIVTVMAAAPVVAVFDKDHSYILLALLLQETNLPVFFPTAHIEITLDFHNPEIIDPDDTGYLHFLSFFHGEFV